MEITILTLEDPDEGIFVTVLEGRLTGEQLRLAFPRVGAIEEPHEDGDKKQKKLHVMYAETAAELREMRSVSNLTEDGQPTVLQVPQFGKQEGATV
jgi:hypothetical protein